MNELVKKNWNKSKHLILSALILLSLLLVLVVFKSDERVQKKSLNSVGQFESQEFKIFKEFILKKIESPFINLNYEIVKGDTIQKILQRYKVGNSEIQKIISKYKKYGNPNQLLVGNKIDIIIKRSLKEEKNSILKFSVPVTKSTTISITKDEDNNIISKKIITKLYKKKILSENIIKNNLYSSAIEANVNPDTIIEFARIYGFQVDFQRDIRKEDKFQIMYEVFIDKDKKVIETGEILFANLKLSGQDNSLYYFDKENLEGHYDKNGKSVQKALMKTPINGARLSSSFGMRKHPIDGFNKMHRGTDFAAPKGTPIMASGNGIVKKAGWCGGGGNCVKIRHNSTYETVYAHMSKFARGIKNGVRVKQGQTIGYVGSTGKSTGPHLHYEVIVNGKKINSQKLKLPSGKVLKGKSRELFETVKIKLDVLKSEKIIGLN